MQTKRYLLNPLGVLFHPQIDQQNNYETIVFNPWEEKILRINRYGYDIIKTVDNNPGLGLDDLFAEVGQKHEVLEYLNKEKVFGFIQQMVKEHIIFEK